MFDLESYPSYENENPGTVTAEGFGLECWQHEEVHGKRRGAETVFVSCEDPPDIPASKLLRRAEELRRGGEKFGWNPEKEDAELEELFGKNLE